MRKTDNNLMQEIMLTIMSDDYTKETANLMRSVLTSLHDYALSVGDKHFVIMADAAFERIADHEFRNRLKPDELSDVFIMQLTDKQLSELLTEIEVAGSETKDEEEKNKLRNRYIAVRKEMNERFENK